jgi:hypothetical protein
MAIMKSTRSVYEVVHQKERRANSLYNQYSLDDDQLCRNIPLKKAEERNIETWLILFHEDGWE